MATQSINFGGLGLVKFNNVTCNTVKVNGTTVYTAGLASYSYSNTRENIGLQTVFSDTKTFPQQVSAGSTSIRITGNIYNHYGGVPVTVTGAHTEYTANGLWMYQVRFLVKLYNGSTLLHSTGWSSYYSHGAMSKTWTTTVSQPITKAILYRQSNQSAAATNYLCHSKCVNTITIG